MSGNRCRTLARAVGIPVGLLWFVWSAGVVGEGKIEGMISGPSVFWHYELIRKTRGITLKLKEEDAPIDDLRRIEDHFVSELTGRVQQETKGGVSHFPRYKAGQFYLRRSLVGTTPDSRAAKAAVNDRVLDARFVGALEEWKLKLLYPQ